MGSDTRTPEPPILIRTKLQRPRLPEDLVPRPRLLDRLHAGSDRKLTLISAMAGAGKTTLLAQWLEECPQPSAWLSLDEHDNDRTTFLSYLWAAIRSVFPDACESVLDLLNALQPPPVRVIIASIINQLDEFLLLGIINHLNGLGLPLVSVECLPTPVESELSGQDDA